ncbi:MAG: VWA domain-containing protein [Desulfuromonas sp.]|nr:VWA domain-containing protein [Desulfuromonas sp.]
MRPQWIAILFLSLFFASQGFAASEADLRIHAVKPDATVTVDRVIADGKVLLSVADASRKPLFGLTTGDFVITQAGRTAKILSVQPIAESLDVPRNIVLVLDNSDSMRQRHAIDALLAGVDELLKIVRPIDTIEVVVFDDRQTISKGGRDLHVRTFKSNRAAELKAFVARVYGEGTTANTFLYDAMFAGLDSIQALPAAEPRFMVVFSDGEDLNSASKQEDVAKAAQELARFDAYAIDYMPGSTTDKFLAAFAARNRGTIWKATSETNLVPIFQSVASKMQYYYVVDYLFPPTGSLTVAPDRLVIDEVRMLDATAQSGAPAAAPEEEADAPSSDIRIDTSALMLQPTVDSVYGIARWKILVANTRGSVAELAGEGPPARQITVPLPTGNLLPALAVGGDLAVRMEAEDRKGQTLVLTAPAVKLHYLQTRAGLEVTPTSLTIEEIRTIDASPMLGHIYFAKGSNEIPAQYVRLAGPEATAGFDEQQFRDTLEKYYQVLNIVGKRLVDHPEATITLVGCNADAGAEKGKKKLSTQRAEAVRSYLQAVWNIAPERMPIEVRNLPEMPSTSRIEEGQAENRRVEIRSAAPAILDLIRSTYLANRIDAPALTLKPSVVSPHGIVRWKIVADSSTGRLADLGAEGEPAAQITVPLPVGDLKALAAAGDIEVRMEMQDRKGQRLVFAPVPIKVNFIQTSQRLAQKQDLRVQEKYALILFDFDKDTIDARNQAIVDTIVARIRELPQATVEIVGHTDNIGKEAYNLKLSERRALAVYKLLAAAYGENPGERMRYAGVGPNSPLYDNLTPEARSFNRTVTITLEYLSAE